MDLGSRIKAARLEAGLSQRQLCGEVITRNMLSQIENGSARPSMATLGYLSRQLGKPVSYFLEEKAVVSPNLECMEQARQAQGRGDCREIVKVLESFREPDDTFVQERNLLLFLGYLGSAELAIEENRLPYALTLLEKAGELGGIYITPDLQRRRQLLLGRAGGAYSLEGEDEALLLLAQQAPTPQRSIEILGAVRDKNTPHWNLQQAEALFAMKWYEDAAAYYVKAEQTDAVLARLEVCCRELGDYKGAYEYARRQNQQKV